MSVLDVVTVIKKNKARQGVESGGRNREGC